MKRQDIGTCGEEAACEFLKKKGYKIVQRNFRCRLGEIDIVAKNKVCLVFVEVRTKTGIDFGSPEESVTRAKKDKLIITALAYINTLKQAPESWRIDFIAVELDHKWNTSRVELIENAIS
jgi:putative endonuclease